MDSNRVKISYEESNSSGINTFYFIVYIFQDIRAELICKGLFVLIYITISYIIARPHHMLRLTVSHTNYIIYNPINLHVLSPTH